MLELDYSAIVDPDEPKCDEADDVRYLGDSSEQSEHCLPETLIHRYMRVQKCALHIGYRHHCQGCTGVCCDIVEIVDDVDRAA